MSAILKAGTLARQPATPRPDHTPAVCGCGQDLDVVSGRHCPRCGTQLGVASFEPVGFWYAA